MIKLEEVNYNIDAILCCNAGCLCNRTLGKEDPSVLSRVEVLPLRLAMRALFK
jgi:hypothetical protein